MAVTSDETHTAILYETLGLTSHSGYLRNYGLYLQASQICFILADYSIFVNKPYLLHDQNKIINIKLRTFTARFSLQYLVSG